MKFRLADGEAKLHPGPFGREELVLKVEALEEEAENADYARADLLMGRAAELWVGSPMRGIEARDSVLAGNVRPSAQRPNRVQELRRLRCEEMVAFVMGFVDRNLP